MTDLNLPTDPGNTEASENTIHCGTAASDRSGLVTRVGTNDGVIETPYRLVTEHFSHHSHERDRTDTLHVNENSPESRYSPIFGNMTASFQLETTWSNRRRS